MSHCHVHTTSTLVTYQSTISCKVFILSIVFKCCRRTQIGRSYNLKRHLFERSWCVLYKVVKLEKRSYNLKRFTICLRKHGKCFLHNVVKWREKKNDKSKYIDILWFLIICAYISSFVYYYFWMQLMDSFSMEFKGRAKDRPEMPIQWSLVQLNACKHLSTLSWVILGVLMWSATQGPWTSWK